MRNDIVFDAVARYFGWLFAIAALAICFSSCAGTAGVFGLASTDRLEERTEDLQAYSDRAAAASVEQTKEAVLAAFQPVEPLVPGISNYIAASFENSRYKPPLPVPAAPDEPALPWWMEELATAAVATGLAYVGVNRARDARRKARGEPVAVAATANA